MPRSISATDAGDVVRLEGEQAGKAVGIEAAGLGQTIVGQRASAVPMRGSSICTPGAVSSNIWRSMPRSSIRAIRSGPISHSSCCSCSSAAKFPAMRSELSSGGQGERSRASWASRISGCSTLPRWRSACRERRGRSAATGSSAPRATGRCRHRPSRRRSRNIAPSAPSLTHDRYQPSRPSVHSVTRPASTSSGMSPLSSTASWKPLRSKRSPSCAFACSRRRTSSLCPIL